MTEPEIIDTEIWKADEQHDDTLSWQEAEDVIVFEITRWFKRFPRQTIANGLCRSALLNEADADGHYWQFCNNTVFRDFDEVCRVEIGESHITVDENKKMPNGEPFIIDKITRALATTGCYHFGECTKP